MTEHVPNSRRRGRLPSGEANPVDVYVGQRIRLRRTMAGLSQVDLAERVGITFQQIQKYENGSNRISASRLYDLSGVLNCAVDFFFEEMEDHIADLSPRNMAEGSVRPITHNADPMNKRETLDLVRAYFLIQDQGIRQSIFRFTKFLSENCDLAK